MKPIKDIATFFNFMLNSEHQRSAKIKKNIIILIVLKGLSVINSFLLVPLTIHYLNTENYGIWITISSVIAWINLFDIGLGNGLRNKLAEALAFGKTEEARSLVSTAYITITFIASAIFLIFLIINNFINWNIVFNVSAEMHQDLSLIVLGTALFFCLRFILQLINMVLTADQNPSGAALITSAGSIISLAAVYILTQISTGSIFKLLIAFSVSHLSVLIFANVFLFNNKYKKIAICRRYIRFQFLNELMNLGIKFFIIQIASLILYQSSNMIIIHLFGPEEVTKYNIAFKYFNITIMFFGIILTPFWSAFTEAYSLNDWRWIKGMIKKLIIFWIILLCFSTLMLLYSNWFYRLWVGDSIKINFSLSFSLYIYIVITMWNSIFVYFLNGIGKIKLQLYSGILGALFNIPLAIFLGHKFGLSGIVFSSSILSSLNVIWISIQYHKIINNKAIGIWAE